jgi:hypothetical protein
VTAAQNKGSIQQQGENQRLHAFDQDRKEDEEEEEAFHADTPPHLA